TPAFTVTCHDLASIQFYRARRDGESEAGAGFRAVSRRTSRSEEGFEEAVEFTLGHAFAFVSNFHERRSVLLGHANKDFFIRRAMANSVPYNILDRTGERFGEAGHGRRSVESRLHVHSVITFRPTFEIDVFHHLLNQVSEIHGGEFRCRAGFHTGIT